MHVREIGRSMGQETEERAMQGSAAGETVAQTAGASGTGGASKPASEPDRISSPEQIDDYIRVTTPGMWLLVAAILVLLTAGIIWGYAAKVEMNVTKQDGTTATEYVSPASFLTDGNTGS